MNQNATQKARENTIAPDELLDETLYHVLQLDKEDAVFLSAIHDEKYRAQIFGLLYK